MSELSLQSVEKPSALVYRPEAVLLMGIQAAGKSTFVRQFLYDTHVRVNLDMLRTRVREAKLIDSCLQSKTPFVLDNTNINRAARARHLPAIKAAGFRVTGYIFEAKLEACLRRNDRRDRMVPWRAIYAAHQKMELPSVKEGFDELFFVVIEADSFNVTPWQNPEDSPLRDASSPRTQFADCPEVLAEDVMERSASVRPMLSSPQAPSQRVPRQ